MRMQIEGDVLVYVGTYTQTSSEGIYVYHLDTTSGALSYVATSPPLDSPSFLVIDSNQRYLYAVNEVGEFGGEPTGAVSALEIDASTGGLTLLNQQSSGGGHPCHLDIDAGNGCIVVANYGGGTVSMLRIRDDGSLGPPDTIIHEGSSILPRQETPHAHSITVAPGNTFAVAADLGMDKVLVYRINREDGLLEPHDEVAIQAGAGPRHMAFHPNGRFVYLINEIDNTMNTFAYDGKGGGLTELQSVSTLPADWQGASGTAEVRVHPSGKFLYGSNRGHDSIAIYTIDGETGRLQIVDFEPTQGEHPRNFNLDPSGTFLLAANHNSDTIYSYWVDQTTGKLTPTGHGADAVGMPVCLKFTVR